MWGTNIIVILLAIGLLARMGREGATSRGGDWTELIDSLRARVAKVGRLFGIPLDRRHQAPG
jgi:hypothetical protein